MATLTTRQTVAGSIVITKADGTQATVSGVPVWASSDETILVAVAAADGMSAAINAVSASANTARVTVTANADMDPTGAVIPIIGTSEDITVTLDPRDQATAITMTLGAPADKP